MTGPLARQARLTRDEEPDEYAADVGSVPVCLCLRPAPEHGICRACFGKSKPCMCRECYPRCEVYRVDVPAPDALRAASPAECWAMFAAYGKAMRERAERAEAIVMADRQEIEQLRADLAQSKANIDALDVPAMLADLASARTALAEKGGDA